MIWPFNLLTNKTPQKEVVIPPFENIFYVKDGVKWKYMPAKDITAYEAAMMAPAFFNAFTRFDYIAYFEKHNLMRHFVRIEE